MEPPDTDLPAAVPSAGDAWLEVVVATFEDGQRRSMVGPGDVRVHVEHARALATALPQPERLLDLGTGAGIPGLVLAGLWETSLVVLVDAAQRRVDLVRNAIRALGWMPRVEAVHARAEALGRRDEHRGSYDLVTARLFGPPAVVAECAAPFLRVGGTLVVTEPPGADGSRWPADGLAVLGMRPEAASDGLQVIRQASPAPDRFPRKDGVAAKRPLF